MQKKKRLLRELAHEFTNEDGILCTQDSRNYTCKHYLYVPFVGTSYTNEKLRKKAAKDKLRGGLLKSFVAIFSGFGSINFGIKVLCEYLATNYSKEYISAAYKCMQGKLKQLVRAWLSGLCVSTAMLLLRPDPSQFMGRQELKQSSKCNPKRHY